MKRSTDTEARLKAAEMLRGFLDAIEEGLIDATPMQRDALAGAVAALESMAESPGQGRVPRVSDAAEPPELPSRPPTD